MIPTLPNGDTLMLEKAFRIANMIEARVPGKPDAPAGTVFLPSSEYGALMREIASKAAEVPKDFLEQKHFLIGRVTFRNAGTDDAEAVKMANAMYAEQTGFQWKAEHLRTG